MVESFATNAYMFISGIWTQQEVESQQAMLDKLLTDLQNDSSVARAVMDSHPDERRAQEALAFLKKKCT